MQADLVLYNIGQLVTSRELDNTKKMDNIEVIENNGYIVIEKDKIVAVGSGEVPKEYQTKLIILPDIFFQTNKGAFLYMKEQDFLSRYKDLNLKRKIIKDTIIYTSIL